MSKPTGMNLLALLGLDALMARWRGAVREGVAAVDDRITLARLEWQDHRERLRLLLVLMVLAVAVTMGLFLVLTAAVLVQFWDTPYRNWVSWCLAGIWLAAWACLVWRLWVVSSKLGDGFALTRQELAQDWQDIKERL
jgi:uncharacterized membrane protein YqjE